MQCRSLSPLLLLVALPALATPLPDAEQKTWEWCNTDTNVQACNRYLEGYPNRLFVQQGWARQGVIRSPNQSRVPSLTPPDLIDGRFEIITDGGEVRDLKTKLIWQRCEIGQHWNGQTCTGRSTLFTYEKAQKNTGDGWKVPSKNELSSLLTQDITNKRYINSNVFSNTSEMVWSSTANTVNSEFAWAVFYGGGVSSDAVARRYKHAVRLVRVDR